MTQIETKKLTVFCPYDDIVQIMEQYLRQVEAVQPYQMVTGLGIPIQRNEENLVEVYVHLMDSGSLN